MNDMVNSTTKGARDVDFGNSRAYTTFVLKFVSPEGCSKAYVVSPAGVRTARSLACFRDDFTVLCPAAKKSRQNILCAGAPCGVFEGFSLASLAH